MLIKIIAFLSFMPSFQLGGVVERLVFSTREHTLKQGFAAAATLVASLLFHQDDLLLTTAAPRKFEESCFLQ